MIDVSKLKEGDVIRWNGRKCHFYTYMITRLRSDGTLGFIYKNSRNVNEVLHVSNLVPSCWDLIPNKTTTTFWLGKLEKNEEPYGGWKEFAQEQIKLVEEQERVIKEQREQIEALKKVCEDKSDRILDLMEKVSSLTEECNLWARLYKHVRNSQSGEVVKSCIR